ncbi:MAG: restriction endonuclease subunit S [Crocosphaera sp.]
MSFQFSSDINKNKIFLVNLTDCRVRLDPYYYKPEFLALRKRLENHPLFQKMGSLIKSWNRGDGPREGFYTDDTENGVFFLRVNNLKNHTIDINEIKYITRYVHENTLKRAKVSAGDVVFAISGTKDNLGTVSVIPESILEANLNSALVKLELNWSVIDKRYFCYMFDLNITRTQINFIGKGAAQNNLNNEEISQIHLFLPPINHQKKIVLHLDEAHIKKEKKEAEAQRLLDSIDDYLLSELGIELPKLEDSIIQNRIFYRNFSEVSGNRFDSHYYKNIYEATKQSILHGRYCVSRLRRIAINIRNGVERRNYSDSGIRYLRVTDLGKHEINDNQPRYVDVEKVPSRIILNSKCLLVSRSGSLGLVSVVKPDIENTILSSHIVRVELDVNIVLPDYVEAFLRSKIGQIEIFRENNGGVIPEINQMALGNIEIPCPPLEKQLEIVDRITAIRNQAKQLRKEAEAELEQAKQEVEAMILGD